MSNQNRKSTYIHIFPSFKLPREVEVIGNLKLKSRSLLSSEDADLRAYLSYAFSIFKDPFDRNLEEGIYMINETSSVVEDVWSLLRYASYVPSEYDEVSHSIHLSNLADWFSFHILQHQGDEDEDENKKFEIFNFERNGAELWQVFSSTRFFPFIQRLHAAGKYISLSDKQLKISKQLANLFLQDDEYDIESSRLAERIRKAIYWYIVSFERGIPEHRGGKSSYWNLEAQILYMALAFETIFQPPKNDIQKHLETSLKVLFPDNEFVPKWLGQFYSARSAIAHGSSPESDELVFKPDRSSHNSLIYWSRKIFRNCVAALVSQWETSRESGLLKSMTPNRIRLKRIQGKLQKYTNDGLCLPIPNDIEVDIRDLHASWMDTPDESYLVHTHNIGKILCKIFVSLVEPSDELRSYCEEVLSLGDNWYETLEQRSAACRIYTSIIEFFGDKANIIQPLVQLDTDSQLEQVLYHWSRFAYAHIWSIDI